MTPKEKAIELYNKFEKIIIDANADYWSREAKQCAFIVVEEIIKELLIYGFRNRERIPYWNEVKQELEKL